MTFLPWIVPQTERQVQQRELGANRGHLVTESCSDVHLQVYRRRTGDEDFCCCSVGSRRQNITWRCSCSIEDVTAAFIAAAGCCSST